MSSKNSMLLITSPWQDTPSFRLIPLSQDTPYNEAIYDPKEKVLALVGKSKKDSFKFLPKLDQNGDVEFLKSGSRRNGSPIKEERRMLETWYEYYIREEKEIEAFVNLFAANADTFDWKAFTNYTEPTQDEPLVKAADMKALIMAP